MLIYYSDIDSFGFILQGIGVDDLREDCFAGFYILLSDKSIGRYTVATYGQRNAVGKKFDSNPSKILIRRQSVKFLIHEFFKIFAFQKISLILTQDPVFTGNNSKTLAARTKSSVIIED
jgi:hypothetical protein